MEIERKLASTKFAKSGCIYFREDFPDGDALVTTPPLSLSTVQRFTLGPLVDSGMWRGAKASMGMNRGPFKSVYNTYSFSWFNMTQITDPSSLLK